MRQGIQIALSKQNQILSSQLPTGRATTTSEMTFRHRATIGEGCGYD
jgi:hypothetical protein